MKKSVALSVLGLVYAMCDQSEFIEDRPAKKPCPSYSPRKYIKFNESEGVLNLIKEYNLIKLGESKKGLRKQERTIAKINQWLESGMLNESDLNQEI